MNDHQVYPREQNSQVVHSGRNIEVLEITTSGTAQQIVFTDYVKEIVVRNIDATNAINLLGASDATVGFTLIKNSLPLTLRLSGKKLQLWVKCVAGTPTIQLLGIR